MPKNKDWTGNGYSMKTIGSSSHSENERELNDYYATEPKAVRLLCELEQFDKNIWECACGEGHLSKELTALGYSVFSSDLINRGFGEVMDFLSVSYLYEGDIITILHINMLRNLLNRR